MGKNYVEKSEGNQNIVVEECQEFKFATSEQDSTLLGLPDNINYEIGPTSIIINYPNLYILDPLFRNIKRINISSGKLEVSEKIPHHAKSALKDMTILNDKLYIMGQTDSLYVFSLNLDYLYSLGGLYEGRKVFFSNAKNIIEIYCGKPSIVVSLNNQGNIIEKKEDSDHKYGSKTFRTYLGNEFKIISEKISDTLKIDNTNYILKTKVQNITKEYYESKNLGFNDSIIAYFNIFAQRDSIALYVCKRK